MPTLDLSNADVRLDDRGRPQVVKGCFPLENAAELQALGLGEDLAQQSGITDRSSELVNGAVRAFLAQHADDLDFHVPPTDLRLAHAVREGVTWILRYDHFIDDVPIWGRQVMVQVDTRTWEVVEIALGHERDALQADATAHSRSSVWAYERAQLLVQALHRTRGQDLHLRQVDAASHEVVRPVLYPDGARLYRAYRVLVLTESPVHDWQVLLAESDSPLPPSPSYRNTPMEERITDLVCDMAPAGMGLVFDPNPVVTKGDHNLSYQPNPGVTPAVDALYRSWLMLSALQDVGTAAVPGYELAGEAVQIYDFEPPASPAPKLPSTAFNFPSNSPNWEFEAVMICCHIDRLQRYLHGLGITQAQPGAGGKVQADPAATDSDGRRAWYSYGDKGLHFGPGSEGHDSAGNPVQRPDAAEDADCILHEYGHAMLHHQVPSTAGTQGWGAIASNGRYETRAMGEGFGDFLACAYFAPDHPNFQPEVFEDWIYLGGSAAWNLSQGLRRVDSPRLYTDPWGGVGDVHKDGQVWSGVLWRIFRDLGGLDPVLATRLHARDVILETIVRSHHRMRDWFTYPEAAEQVLETHEDYHLGRHLPLILQAFHDRRILPSSPNEHVYIRRHPDDLGDNALGIGPLGTPLSGPDSPDIWVRQEKAGLAHEAPIAGANNWVYVRLWNRGSDPVRAVVVTVHAVIASATPPQYPQDFIPGGGASVGSQVAFNIPAAATGLDASRYLRLAWSTQGFSAGDEVALLVSLNDPSEQIPPNTGVPQHRWLAQKKVTIQ